MCKNKLSTYIRGVKMTILSLLNTKNVKNKVWIPDKWVREWQLCGIRGWQPPTVFLRSTNPNDEWVSTTAKEAYFMAKKDTSPTVFLRSTEILRLRSEWRKSKGSVSLSDRRGLLTTCLPEGVSSQRPKDLLFSYLTLPLRPLLPNP